MGRRYGACLCGSGRSAPKPPHCPRDSRGSGRPPFDTPHRRRNRGGCQLPRRFWRARQCSRATGACGQQPLYGAGSHCHSSRDCLFTGDQSTPGPFADDGGARRATGRCVGVANGVAPRSQKRAGRVAHHQTFTLHHHHLWRPGGPYSPFGPGDRR